MTYQRTSKYRTIDFRFACRLSLRWKSLRSAAKMNSHGKNSKRCIYHIIFSYKSIHFTCTDNMNHLLTLEWKVRDERMSCEKLVKALSRAKAIFVEKARFDRSKKDFIKQMFFSTLPDSSIFFLKELPTTEKLKEEFFMNLAIVDGFHVDLANSRFDFEKDLWISPRKIDLENASWALNEVPIGDDFQKNTCSFWSRNKSTSLPKKTHEISATLNQELENVLHPGFKNDEAWEGGYENYCQYSTLQKRNVFDVLTRRKCLQTFFRSYFYS